MPFKEALFGFNIVCLELLTSVYYVMLVVPILFPHSINNDDAGQHCIKIVTAAIYCNVGFSAFMTLKKIFIIIRGRIFKRSAKVYNLEITTQNQPVFKVSSLAE